MPRAQRENSFTPKTPTERQALAALRPTSGFGRKEFHGWVLAQLEIIRDPDAWYVEKKHILDSPTKAVRQLRAWAKTAMRMADDLAKQAWSSRLSPFVCWLPAPVEELREYAQRLTEAAVHLDKKIVRTPNRHRVHPQTVEIVQLVNLVAGATGSPHWKDLATLIGAACKDSSWNEDRLRKAVKYHQKREPESKPLGDIRTSKSQTRQSN
jgi:hypothetical protein